MTQAFTFPDPAPFGLEAALADAGCGVHILDGQWVCADGQLAAVNAFITAYDPLPAVQQAKLDQLATIYAGKYAAGFNYIGPDGTKRTFQIDPTSLFNIDARSNAALGAILNGESWPNNAYWIAADNSHMPTPTAQDMRTFAQAAHVYVSTLILTNRALKDAIAAATSVDSVNALDLTAGWPPNP